MDIAPEQKILNDKYLILKRIGEGGMARVWLAEEPKFAHRLVAIKEPKVSTIGFSEEEIRQRFRLEIEIARYLQDASVSNVVCAYTVEEYQGTSLLVMPYMVGGSLTDTLKEFPQGMPWEQVVRIATGVLAGLSGFHDLPGEPVHRDIKPSNILFDDRERAYISDFGVAQVTGFTTDRTLMLGGPHPGDSRYAPPEQLLNDGGYLTQRADIYAFGAVMFEMLTGQRYYEHHGKHPRELQKETPAWLDSVTAKALAADPITRWQSAEAFRNALEEQARVDVIETPETVNDDGLPTVKPPVDREGVAQPPEDRTDEAENSEQGSAWQEFVSEIVTVFIALIAFFKPSWFPEGFPDLLIELVGLFAATIAVFLPGRRARRAIVARRYGEQSVATRNIEALVALVAIVAIVAVVAIVAINDDIFDPTATAAIQPSPEPFEEDVSVTPSMSPTETPTPFLTNTPTSSPTFTSTVLPTHTPTSIPHTNTPTPNPTPTNTPTASPTHTPTVRPTQTPTPTPPTNTPIPRATVAPTLRTYLASTQLSPTNGFSFDPGSSVTLQWSDIGPLSSGDHYLLTVTHKIGTSYVATDNTQWSVPDWMEEHQPVSWQVQICRVDQTGESDSRPSCTYESPASATWQFDWFGTSDSTNPNPTPTKDIIPGDF